MTTQHLTGLAAGRRHRAAGALPARARRAPRGGRSTTARRPGSTSSRARRRRSARLPGPDAVPDAGRAGRRDRRVGACCRWSDRPVWTRWRASASAAGRADGGAGAAAEVRRRRRAAAGRPSRYAGRRAARAAASPGGCRYGVDLLVPRAPWPTWSARARRAAGRALGVRGAAGGRPAAAAGPRDRPPHAAGRGGLAGRRGAPGQGLLPRARRRWPGCTTWAGRRAGWCCCTSTASPPTSCPAPGTPVTDRRRPDGRFRRHGGPPLRAGPDRAGGGQAERRRRRRRCGSARPRRRRSTPGGDRPCATGRPTCRAEGCWRA